MKEGWTPEQNDLLLKHWPMWSTRPLPGWTAEKIGALIGKTKCAVIGQVHRGRNKAKIARLEAALRELRTGERRV